MKVLIIDDERSIRNTLKEILEFEGHEVVTAEDGKQGVDKALADSFDAIFCDIKMPVMDGNEVLDTLVQAGCESSIIMISGHGDIETAVKCIKKGAYDFIQKPLDLNRILITLKMPPTRPRWSRKRSASRKRFRANTKSWATLPPSRTSRKSSTAWPRPTPAS